MENENEKPELEFNPNKELKAPVVEEKEIELPHALKLRYPITVGKKEYKELLFVRLPNARCVAHIPVDVDQWKMGHFSPMIVRMTDVSLIVVEELAPKDYADAVRVAQHFF